MKGYMITINTMIEKYETMIQNNISYSKKDVETLRSSVDGLLNFMTISDEEKNKIQERISFIEGNAKEGNLFLSSVSPKSMSIKATKKNSIKRKVAAIGIGTIILGSIGGITLTSCGSNKIQQEQSVIVNNTMEKMAPSIPDIEPSNTMDSEYLELADSIVESMNDSISKGLEVTEDDKVKFSKEYSEYFVLNNIDTLTTEQWANIFPDSRVVASDIMQSKYDIEYVDEKRAIVSSDYLDYSLIFDENDAKMLTSAAEALNKVKSAKTTADKKQANADFLNLINEILDIEKQQQVSTYSFRALDTFRTVYFDGFNELTTRSFLSDELKHSVNTMVLCSLKNSNLNVENEEITTIQSKIVVELNNKVEARLQDGWNYAQTHELNENNDIDHIAEYVSSHIDLSLYQEMPDIVETMSESVLPPGEKSKDDSGISDGQIGNLSKSDMIDHGVDPSAPNAKDDYEQAVRDEAEKKSEESKVITDNDGNVISSGADADEQDAVDNYETEYNSGFEAGAKSSDGTCPSGHSSAWNDGFKDGYAWKLSNLDEKKTETVDNGETTTEDSSEEIEDYVKVPDNDNSTGETETTFEPIEENETETTFEPIEENEVETTFEPVEENEMETTFEPVEENEMETTFEPIEENEVETTFESSEKESNISSELVWLKELRDMVANEISATNEEVENVKKI